MPPALAPDPVPAEPTPQAQWRDALERVRAVSPRHAKSLAFGRVLALGAGEVRVGFTAQAAFHRATVTGSARPVIERALSEHFGRPTRLTVETATDVIEAAARSSGEREAEGRAVREQGVEARVRAHPAVLTALRVLGGTLEHIQVLEAGGAAVAGGATVAGAAPSDRADGDGELSD